jgi:SsrA-binding protein
MKIFAKNKRVYFDYEILENYDAGIELFGFEVKAIKSGKISLKGSFVIIKDEEAFLINAQIAPYQPKNTPQNYDPKRKRKLLLKKSEIRSLLGKTKQQGLTLVPLFVYNKGCKIKLKIGLAKSKKKYQKKQKIKEREIQREAEREIKSTFTG